MLHFAAHAYKDSTLFDSWPEGLALWRRLTAISGVVAAVIMPNHVHLLVRHDVRRQVLIVMRGYARWRNHRRQQIGRRVWAPLPAPSIAATPQKQRRDVRYIHLNPVRAGLVRCPLQWPLSTHRDAVGLSVPGVCRPNTDPHWFHQYVSNDEHTGLSGTDLPDGMSLRKLDSSALPVLLNAVSAVTRATDDEVRVRGPARSLYLRTARAHTTARAADIGALVGVQKRAVNRVPRRNDAASAVVMLVAADSRFSVLPARADLRRLQGWNRKGD